VDPSSVQCQIDPIAGDHGAIALGDADELDRRGVGALGPGPTGGVDVD
jgi:hypothetical protein